MDGSVLRSFAPRIGGLPDIGAAEAWLEAVEAVRGVQEPASPSGRMGVSLAQGRNAADALIPGPSSTDERTHVRGHVFLCLLAY